MEILVRILLAGLLALLALPAQAKEGDTFRPFVSAGYFYDSNLFRLADEESPGFRRDDRYALYSAGLDVDWKPGRQQVVANATRTLVRYERNSAYDFDGSDYKAAWNWRLGNRLSGNLGASESLSQSNFDSVGLVNNEVTRKRYFGRAEWELHPRWRVGAGAAQTDNTNSASHYFYQDFDQRTQEIFVAYRTPKGSQLRAEWRRNDADFPTMQMLGYHPFLPLVALSDLSYEQDEFNLHGDWKLTGKLALRGQAGWVEREYRNAVKGSFGGFDPWLVARPDFSGFNGRVSADWYATGKTLVTVASYRELGGAQDIDATSVLKTGASVNGVWLVREKWRVNAGATYEKRDYRGDMAEATKAREDDTLGATLSLNYMPLRMLSVDAGMTAGRRDSNRNVDDYSFHSFFVNVRGDF